MLTSDKGKLKKLMVGMVLLVMGLSFLSPVGQALAQQYNPDPGESPPYDANPANCLTQLMQEYAAPNGTAPGPLLTKDYANIQAQYYACWNAAVAKEQDWWYRRAMYLKNQWGMRFMTALYGGLIDAMTMISQRIAYEAASDLLYGNPGNEPRFWNKDFGSWLGDAGMDASSKFLDRLDVVVGDWTQSMTATTDKNGNVIPGYRFSFCTPPNPLTLKLSLGIGEQGRMGPGACNLKRVADNFSAIADMVDSGQALQINRPSVQYGASDLSVGVETNQAYFNYLLNQRAGAALNRQEDHGLRPVMDVVSGRIQVPSVLAEDSYKKLSPIEMGMTSESEQRSAILNNYFMVGLENIPLLALSTFSNTLIVGLLHKWLDPKTPGATAEGIATPDEIQVTLESLQNQDASGDAQDLYQRQEFAKALGDYLVPNFASTEDRDIISELTTCNTPRKRFNCAMDQALGVAISVGTKDGALTVGRAAGIGSENATFSPSSQALHADWELVPENDIKDNTDPTCAQRAYCAGNLKKMRLARVIPVGWEMAANSPYNQKHNGKYITLGEVIRGFYDCNDQGKLDKDHPWCHLIDPNWILAAPKYQCRAKGYGDAILPSVGTRLEECGDMVSCLATNQNGACVGGYGYCLAERPVWKFDSKTCDQQFVSCRTYNTSQGGQISLLRNTEDKGKCSEGNQGCSWYATQRYVTSTKSPDGLWVGTVTSGPRVYLDRGVQPCTSEGCTKVYRVPPVTADNVPSVLNLVQNGSFEQTVKDTQGNLVKFNGWDMDKGTCAKLSELTNTLSTDAYDGGASFFVKNTGVQCVWPGSIGQTVEVGANRNYTISLYTKYASASPGQSKLVVTVMFYAKQPDGSYKKIDTKPSLYSINSNLCTWWDQRKAIALYSQEVDGWQRTGCQFTTPPGTTHVQLSLNQTTPDGISYDAVQLEEGEYASSFVDGLAQGLASMYLKIAPDEYKCTGDDIVDNPACQRFARVCRQIDVGCQGYQDQEDVTAPEVPAKLTPKDLCPAICAGYGEYRKLASTFDLVQNPSNPAFDDPQDETTAYFIPSLSEQCTMQDVGCEAFTSMEAAASTGEQVSYFRDIRLCEKPTSTSATYYTWEGSDIQGYQLRTWSLIASDPAHVTSSAPKVVLRGTLLGYIKDPSTCNDITWKYGTDPDCRQFYDVGGHVYYAFYSQTVSSDPSCTDFRKDLSTQADCEKTGGKFQSGNQSCLYSALPAESLTCSAAAGGCRAYLGPTGRNAVNVYQDTFATGTVIAFDKKAGSDTSLQFSNESILVGDRSLKLQAGVGHSIDAVLKLPVISTSSLMRVSFWLKGNRARAASDQASQVLADGKQIGTFYPDINWARFEVGPFMPSGSTTRIELVIPPNQTIQDNIVYLDTFSVDQLNDVQFVRQNHWAVPIACDSTPEGVPELHAMVGCREYKNRLGDTAFVRNFSQLCRATAIGCEGFIDTRGDKPNAYSEIKAIKGTPFPADFNTTNYAKHGAAKDYESQFFGDWSATSSPYRYYYAIDDDRGRCDASQDTCRAYGQPVFRQDRIALATTTSDVDPADADVFKNQSRVFAFQTVLLKDDWTNYVDDNGDPKLACRKDELFCDKFTSGQVTEYFRDPGDQTCIWVKTKRLKANPDLNIPADGDYSGWFRQGTDIPCYPPYLAGGNEYLIQYSGELDYAGWGGQCPLDQSECTEFVDPNDKSDTTHPNGRSYYMINGPSLDKSSCGGTADPLSGCVLFNDTSLGNLQANSQATYAKVMAERGAPQTPLDCVGDPSNQYCQQKRVCGNFTDSCHHDPGEVPVNGDCVAKQWKYVNDFISTTDGKSCQTDNDCMGGSPQLQITVGGKCGVVNDSNVVLKVKMDRECARWMGCRTGETVYDPGQQKFVTQCSQMELCQKNGSTNDDIYCSEFTDRSKEDYLSPGQFVDMESYSGRQIGFGKMDYSGYVASDHYLVADMTSRPMGEDLLQGKDNTLADKYKNDLRLLAQVPLGLTQVSGDKCKDPRTGREGYKIDGQYCYLPIQEQQSLVMAQAQNQPFDVSTDASSLEAEFAKGPNPNNAPLQSAAPAPECQIYPEESSPLPAFYVQEWNTHTNPPTPKTMVQGYENAKTCVYGEDCSCSYRKVRYSAGEDLYYGVNGSPPMIGICKGGPRDGQPCINRQYMPVGANGTLLVAQSVLGVYSPCGEGGVCSEIQDVVYVSGRYGYCVERDLTRTIDAPQAIAPCLTWAPMAMSGRFDQFHFSPTADYMPAQGRGEYYCVTGAQGQDIQTFDHSTPDFDLQTGSYRGMDFYAPGNNNKFSCSYQNIMRQSSLSKQTVYVNGNSNQGPTNDTLPPTDAVPQVQMQDACRRSALCQGKQDAVSCDDTEGLWIQTGPGHEQSYTEYFVPYIPALAKYQNESYYDYHYGMFRFSMVKAPDGANCKWNPAWVGLSHVPISGTDFSCSSYLQQVSDLATQVYDKFNQSFSGILDRSSESMLKDSSDTPMRLRCMFPEGDPGHGCYYKYWQINYNIQSGDKLFDYPKGTYEDHPVPKPDPAKDLGFFNPKTVYNGSLAHKGCDADHPYFSIRAMFQNINTKEDSLSEDLASSREMDGPWQFVGFWVTACMPYQFTNYTQADNGLMYLRLQDVRVDICREVAQVEERTTREHAPFMDRVWSAGKFIVPFIGANYSRYNEPFGSAIASHEIAADPMIMGDSIPPSGDPNRTPTFPDAGKGLAANFVGTDMDPWFSLTNLFARVYTVYKWDVNQIYPDTPVCTNWPGKSGTDLGTRPTCLYAKSNGAITIDQALANIKACSGWDSAMEVTDQSLLSQTWSCNALSGVNRGLWCGRDNTSDQSSDPLCHNAPVMYWHLEDPDNGSLTVEQSLYGTCVQQQDGSRPAIDLPTLHMAEPNKNFVLQNFTFAAASVCKHGKNVPSTLLLLNSNDQAKSFDELAQIGNGYHTYSAQPTEQLTYQGHLYRYYQEDLLSPSNIQDTIFYIIKKGLSLRDYYYKQAFQGACYDYSNNIFAMNGLISPTLERKSIIINIENVAKIVGEYYSAAYTELSQTVDLSGYTADQLAAAKVAFAKGYAARTGYDVNLTGQDKVIAEHLGGDILDGFIAKMIVQETPAWPTIYNDRADGDHITTDASPVDTPQALFQAISELSAQPSAYDGKLLIPQYINLGPYDIDSLSQFASVYTCGQDTVEPGKRCQPGEAVTDDNGNVVANTFKSNDCPQKIDSASKINLTTINNSTDLSKVLKRVPWTITNNDANVALNIKRSILVPQYGFCFRGLNTSNPGTGQINMNRLDFYNWVYGTNLPQGTQVPETYLEDDLGSVLQDNSGYCLGFNKLARCQTNDDCTFNTNQWWGLHDEGSGKNTGYYNYLSTAYLDIFSPNPDAHPTPFQRSVSLPTPYTPGNATDVNGIESKYKLNDVNGPPILTSLIFLKDQPTYINQQKIGAVDPSGGCGLFNCQSDISIYAFNWLFNDNAPDTFGIKAYIKGLYNAGVVIHSHIPELGTGFYNNGDNTDEDENNVDTHLRWISSWINADNLVVALMTSYFQFPNQYARQFATIVGQTYDYNNTHNTFQRRVTIAPFVVDFWQRFIRSIGYAARSNVYTIDDSGTGIVDMWGADDMADGKWDASDPNISFFTRGRFFVSQLYGNLGDHGYFKTMAINGFTRSQDGDFHPTEPDAVNAVFLWQKVFYTNLFPLLQQNGCHASGIDETWHKTVDVVNSLYYKTYIGDGHTAVVHFAEFFDLCDYFGFGDNYRSQTVKWLNDKIQIAKGGTPGLGEMAQDSIMYQDGWKKDMQYDYFDKTAWGMAMSPTHPAFNLYPGVIPAGIASDPKYNVYLPSHCEPAVGTKQQNLRFEMDKNMALTDNWPFEKDWTQGRDDRTWDDPEWIGPKYSTEGFGSTWSLYHLFITPWSGDSSDYSAWLTNKDISKFDANKGMPVTTNDEKLFNASVTLDNNTLSPVEATDVYGTLANSGEPMGESRAVWQCSDSGKIVQFKEQCNQGLIDSGWNYDDYANMADPRNAYIGGPDAQHGGVLVGDLCDIASHVAECTEGMADSYLPPDFSTKCSSTTDDPDQDCNRCTHSPGFKPYVNSLFTYELGNAVSTNYLGSQGQQQHIGKQYPSATDVTSGLDSFYSMTGYDMTLGRGDLIASYKPMPPTVAAPDSSKASNSANATPVFYLNAFSVNNLPQGIVYLGSDQGVAILRFYAWAAHDQGPIRDIAIDWGDGSVTRVSDGSMKNNKPICNSDSECSNVPGLACSGDADCPPGAGRCLLTGRCENTDKFCYKSSTDGTDAGGCGGVNQCKTRMLFGNSSEACRQGYFEFRHTYKASASLPDCGIAKRCSEEPDLLDGQCRPGEAAAARRAPQDGCVDGNLHMARYTPRVMVKDNWGWCTGDCSMSNEPSAFNPNNYGNRSVEVRHPNKGCWDGSAVRYNTNISSPTSPFGNECDEGNKQGRPWIVFQGSIELSLPQ